MIASLFDCIAIKSGRNNDGRRVNVPSENIVIQKCTMKDGHGGVTMGSECSGSIRNVYAEDCNFNSANLDRALRIKTNSIRGGTIENIFMRNCTIGRVANEVFQIDMQYQEGDAGSFTPIVRNIEMKNVTGSNCPKIFNFNCYQRSPATNIKIIDCSFTGVSSNTLINVEKLQIYNSFSNGSVPLIPTPLSGFTHAETYSSKSDWGWSNVKTGFTGNSYMEPVAKNNFIEWNFSAAGNQMDTIVWTYANNSPETLTGSLFINSEWYSLVQFPSTSSNWKTIKTAYKANRGTNAVRLVLTDNTPSLYLDRINIINGPQVVTGLPDKTDAGFFLSCIPSFFNYSSNISIHLPYTDFITLDLWTLQGSKVLDIYSGNCPSGETTVKLNREDLSAGMYLVRLSSSSSTITHKIIITD
jgi:hypothetical protein